MNIGIIGGGVVGSATARAFMEWADVRVYDRVKHRATHSLLMTLESDLVFICLPTPQMVGSTRPDTSAITSFFGDLSPEIRCLQTCWVIKSTVPIGFTSKLRDTYGIDVVHSPEFLTARAAFVDAQLPARNIIGCSSSSEALRRLTELYKRRFPAVQTLHMKSEESEAVKLILNSFFAVKVAYFNEARTLIDKLDLNWETVLGGVLSDGRIAHSHTQVPGPDGKRGFGGACLPKDLASLCYQLLQAGLSNEVTWGALTRNEKDRLG